MSGNLTRKLIPSKREIKLLRGDAKKLRETNNSMVDGHKI